VSDELAQQRMWGTVLSFAGIGISTASGLVLTPVLLGAIGDYDYGLFSLATSLVSLIMLLDLGVSDGAIRFLVSARSGNAPKSMSWVDVLTQVNRYYQIIAILMCGAGVILVTCFPQTVSGISVHDQQRLTTICAVAFLGTVLATLCNGYNSALVAEQRFVFLKCLDLVAQVTSSVLVLVAAWRGAGVLSIVVVITCCAALPALARVIYVRRVFGYRRVPTKVNAPFLRQLLVYSVPILVVAGTEVVYWKLDAVIIASSIGPAAVTIYAVGIQFNKHLLRFATVFSRVAAPQLIKSLDEGRPMLAIVDDYLSVSRLQFISVLYVLMGVILFGKHFLGVWLGNEFLPAYSIMTMTMCAYAVEIIGNLRNVILQINGLYWARALIVAGVSLINVLLTFLLIELMGVSGAALASMIGILVSLPLVLFLLSWKLDFPVFGFYRQLFKGIVLAATLAAAVGCLICQLNVGGWSGLVLKAVLFSIVYWAAIWNVGASASERLLFKSRIKLMTKGKMLL